MQARRADARRVDSTISHVAWGAASSTENLWTLPLQRGVRGAEPSMNPRGLPLQRVQRTWPPSLSADRAGDLLALALWVASPCLHWSPCPSVAWLVWLPHALAIDHLLVQTWC